MEGKSLADRKKAFLEDCCGGGGPTMSRGDAGYQSASPAEGPTATIFIISSLILISSPL